jgi:hypothetical protein
MAISEVGKTVITGTKGSWDVRAYVEIRGEQYGSPRSIRPAADDWSLLSRRDDARVANSPW